MRPSLALELAGELSSVLHSSRQVLTRARVSQIPRATTRNFSSTWRQYAEFNNNNSNGNGNAGAAVPSAAVRQANITPRAPAPATATATSATPAPTETMPSLTAGLKDPPPTLSEDEKQVDWSRSFHGLSSSPFSQEQSAILTGDINQDDVEVKPDGIVYLPEIKYRRILNKAFGPGGWGLAPRGETIVTGKLVTREYGLVAGGRYVIYEL